LIVIFAFCVQVTIFLFTISSGGVSPEDIKTALKISGFYTLTSEQIGEGFKSGDAEVPDAVTKIIKKHVTPEYLETKANTLIDDTSLWASGKTQTPPEISFPEIKSEILKQNPKLIDQLKELEASAKEAQKNAPEDQDMADANGSDGGPGLVSFGNLVEKDFKFSLEKQLSGIKSMHNFLKIAVPLSAIISLIFLLLIFFTSPNSSNKIFSLGLAFLVTALFSGICYFISSSISISSILTILGSTINTNLNKVSENRLAEVLVEFANYIGQIFFNSYSKIQLYAGVGALALGISLIIVSKNVIKDTGVNKVPSGKIKKSGKN